MTDSPQDTQGEEALTRGRMTAYASGNFAKNILWHSAEISVLFIFTDLLGYGTTLAGALLLLSLVWDAILDPIVGFAADKTKTRLGRYGPYIILGAPLSALFFILLFSLPLLPAAPVVLGFLILLAFRAAYSLIDLPHNALIAAISRDSRKRTELATLRFFFSSAASMLLSLSLPIILASQEAAHVQNRFALYSLGAASLSFLTMIFSWNSVRRYDQQAYQNSDKVQTYRAAWTHTRKNHAFLILFAAGALASLTTPMFSKGVIYLSKYVWGDATLSGRALMAMVIGQVVSLPFWTWVSNRYEKSKGLMGAHLTLALAFLISLMISLIHAYTSNDILIAFTFIAGLGAGGIYSLIWSLLPDAIDHGERRLGARYEGIQFGLLIFSMKAASAVGTGLLAFALDVVGYAPNLAQTDIVKKAIVMIVYGAPVAGSIGCAALLLHYRITHKSHADDVNTL